MEGSTATVTDPLIGRMLAGKFRIDGFLGAGAMGSVYRAKQVALDKDVAIKVLKPELAHESGFSERFKREARAASLLDHPNSVRIIDFDEEPDGLLYMAMEFLDGQSLAAVIEGSWPLEPAYFVSILLQVLSALNRAHDVGIVHRDLKPENIMILKHLDESGGPIVKVCDFGIAKMMSRGKREGALTNIGAVIGTPEYMSPEQGRGEELDGRSDLYSVGIILYQMLTGRTPFEAQTSLGLIYKHANEEPRPPSELVPSVSPRLEAVALRALNKRPEDRYSTAREMRGALAEATDGAMPIHSTGPTAIRTRASSSGVRPRHEEEMLGSAATQAIDVQTTKRRRKLQVVFLVVGIVGAVSAAGTLVVWRVMKTNTGPAASASVQATTTGTVATAPPSAIVAPTPSEAPSTGSSAVASTGPDKLKSTSTWRPTQPGPHGQHPGTGGTTEPAVTVTASATAAPPPPPPPPPPANSGKGLDMGDPWKK